MSDVVIVDTSVLLNLLNVPQHNDHRDLEVQQFKQFVQTGASLLLPIAVVFEAGNHIAGSCGWRESPPLRQGVV